MKCNFCEKEIETNTPTTECIECDTIFCLNLVSSCCVDYHKDKKCTKTQGSIPDPTWNINFRNILEIEGKE